MARMTSNAHNVVH